MTEFFDPTSPTGTSNATEAPTSGVTLGAAELAKLAHTNLNDTEYDFVNIIHQHYRTRGELLSAPVGESDYQIKQKDFLKLINDKRVSSALVARGVPLNKVTTDTDRWRNYSLSAEQLFVADVMLDLNDMRSYKKKLQDMKISTGKWDAWLREPAFAQYLDKNTDQLLKNGQHEAALALMDRVKAGDLKAIQYYHEFSGRFIAKPQTAAVTSESADLFNARQLVNDLVEIIIDEVDDHEIAARIADRMKTLMQRNTVVNGLTQTPQIIVPTVEPTRVLTDKQRELMDQGVGMET